MLDMVGKHLCESQMLSYDSFRIISSSAPEKAKAHFSAKRFLLFPRDKHLEIESEKFIRYVERAVEIEKTILNLMEFSISDDPSSTTISSQNLEAYLIRLIPEIDLKGQMHESFYEYYTYTCSQKFFFFLDNRRNNSIRIKKLAHSAIMEELLSLLRLDTTSQDMSLQEHRHLVDSNWFSGGNAVRLYELFLDLDRDQNGMLNIEESKGFAGVSGTHIQFTTTAMVRLFEEYIMYQPFEMDYKGFVNLVLAVENPLTEESLRYFWKIVDYDRSDRLTAEKIKFFYKDIYDSLKQNNGYDAPAVGHVVLEIFDLLSCNNTDGCTYAEVLQSRQGPIVMSMLLDVHGFWRYDNRETIVSNAGAEDGGEV